MSHPVPCYPLWVQQWSAAGERMFLSRVTSALDAKGRVSVPADFRAVIAADKSVGNFDGIVVWPSMRGRWLEASGMALMRTYQELLDNADPYDDVRNMFEWTIFSEGRRLAFDGNGRVSLPKDLAAGAGLNGQVTFVGLGNRFEIWNTNDHEVKAEATRAMAREGQYSLRAVGKPGNPGNPGSPGSGGQV